MDVSVLFVIALLALLLRMGGCPPPHPTHQCYQCGGVENRSGCRLEDCKDHHDTCSTRAVELHGTIKYWEECAHAHDCHHDELISHNHHGGKQLCAKCCDTPGCNAHLCPDHNKVCSACENGGQLDRSTCHCTCPSSWTGDRCQINSCRACYNGGRLNRNTCLCICPTGWTGSRCQIRQCIACQNGGILHHYYGGLMLYTCECKCSSAWTGDRCQTNTCSACQNGGTLNEHTCHCTCPSEWSGDRCQTNRCSACHNGGTLDRDTCHCTCPTAWTGDKCQTNTCSVCQNGGLLNRNTCQCTCSPPWTGDRCETNTCSACQNEGTLNQDNCHCTCTSAWSGDRCQQRITTTSRPTTHPMECEDCTGGTCGETPGSDSVVTCPSSRPYCMITVQNLNEGDRTINKRCAAETDCHSKWWENTVCIGFHPSTNYTFPFSCSYCCTTPRCNMHLYPDTPHLYTATSANEIILGK